MQVGENINLHVVLAVARNTFPFLNGQHIAQPHKRLHRTGREYNSVYSSKIITEMGEENKSNMGGRYLRKCTTGRGLLGQSTRT